MAKALEFTIRQIEALPSPTRGRAEYKDTKEQGLYLRVTPTGVKSFSVVGRAKGSNRVERFTLGKYPQVKPEEARNRARALAGRLASGVSVVAARREKKGEMTVGELWTEYFAYVEKTTKAPKATKEVWETYVGPVWAKRRLSDVSALDVERWHLDLPGKIMRRREEKAAALRVRDEARRREIADRRAIRRHGPDPKPAPEVPRQVAKKVTGHVSANRSVALLRAMYNFGIHQKRKFFLGANPASNHKLFPVNERERFIQPDEFSAFFQALAAEPNESMRDVILLALLTGQRRANVLEMQWSAINLDRAVWTIAGELTKNGLPHVAPLCPEAVVILRQRVETRTSVFVFPSTRSKSGHVGDPKAAWRRLLDKAQLSDLIVHDLRRTLGSWQARSGASLILIGKGLNHKTPEATAIYARVDMDPVRQSIERATSAMFEAAGAKPTAQVIDLLKKEKRVSKGGTNAA